MAKRSCQIYMTMLQGQVAEVEWTMACEVTASLSPDQGSHKG